MARVLIIYYRTPEMAWRLTYSSHLRSFSRFSKHECFYLNAARSRVPGHLNSLKPDLVLFHYTFLAIRQDPPEFEKLRRRVSFVEQLDCPKALLPHDEQTHSDLLCTLIREVGATHVFTPAPESEWSRIYEGVDPQVIMRTILTGYVDEGSLKTIQRRTRRGGERRLDVGYRSWDTYPFYGRHGQLKGEIGRVFKERAPKAGFAVDISSSYRDALLGNSWFDFLLDCRYTIGVEGGSSVFDRDGTIAERTREYIGEHVGAPFEEVEAACFPGIDGQFDYRLLGPRHLEAVMTRTCQVLIEGSYGGVLEPGKHYIELKRDFSNITAVLESMKDEDLRSEIVERAYRDVVASGDYSYRALVDLVFSEALESVRESRHHHRSSRRTSAPLVWNRMDDRFWTLWFWPFNSAYKAAWKTLRPVLVATLGEDRLRRLINRARGLRQ